MLLAQVSGRKYNQGERWKVLLRGVRMMPAILDGHIEVTAETRGGKPRISGSRITVADIVIMHFRLNQSLEEIAGVYDLSLASVHAALTYYYDHREEIDNGIEEDEVFVEAFQRDNPSLLKERLRALGRE